MEVPTTLGITMVAEDPSMKNPRRAMRHVVNAAVVATSTALDLRRLTTSVRGPD